MVFFVFVSSSPAGGSPVRVCLARDLLEDNLPRRWAHVQGVAARARSLAPAFAAGEDLLETAAWLNDIGYLPELASTGLHALDGARCLRDVQHAPPMLCRLVAHHSCAVIEAEERHLADVLRRYGSEHLVSRSIHRAAPMILRAVGDVEAAAR
jgi:HD superfamily phosphodiesterase